MPKRTQVAEELAREFKAKNIVTMPKASTFDGMKLKVTSRGVRRLFGSFRRGMLIVLAYAGRLPVEAPKAKKAVTPPKRTVMKKEEVVDNDPKDIKDTK
jgi:hypothetical protein